MIQFKVNHLNIKQIFECGQAFRWEQIGPDTWIGVVEKTVIRCWQEADTLCLEALNESGSEDMGFWAHYFDIDRNYDDLKQTLLLRSPDLADALEFGSGIRVLNQDLFEMLITFILSSNNHIPRIKQLIMRLCQRYGEPLHRVNENCYYSFPTAKSLAAADLEELRSLGLGYRDAYVLETSKAVCEMALDFEGLKKLSYNEAKKVLLSFNGVGPKVADCILLFGLGKPEAFPIDTWVKKTLARRYNLQNAAPKAIELFIEQQFGDLKGFAQQFLFYFERENERS